MDKEDVVYTYIMEYYSAIKKHEIMPFAGMWIDLDHIMLSERSHTEKDKYCRISPMWNLKNNTKEGICKTETVTDVENKQVVAKWEREGGGAN